jgi:flagellar hook-length control protein FliK
MNTSIAISTPPAPPPAPPVSSTSSKPPAPDDSGFSDQLKKAHSKSGSAKPAARAPAAPEQASAKSAKSAGKSGVKQAQSQTPVANAKASVKPKAAEDAPESDNSDPKEENREEPQKDQPEVAAKSTTTAKTVSPQEEPDQNQSVHDSLAVQPKVTTKTHVNPPVVTVNDQSKSPGGKSSHQQKNQPTDSQDSTTDTSQAAAANTMTAVCPSNAPADTTAKISQQKGLDDEDAPPGTVAAIAAADQESGDATPADSSTAAAANAVTPDVQTQSAADAKTQAAAKTVTPVATPTTATPFPGDPTAAARLSAVAPGAAPSSTSSSENAAANRASIVKAISGQLLPSGGTMQIRLDPPELGVLQVTVTVKEGVISASFETSNDDATKMLSHSLGQLKQALEAQGISVDTLHVQRAPRSEDAGGKSTQQEGNGRQDPADQRNSQRDEQRQEILRRMWRRVSGGRDPLDLVA